MTSFAVRRSGGGAIIDLYPARIHVEALPTPS